VFDKAETAYVQAQALIARGIDPEACGGIVEALAASIYKAGANRIGKYPATVRRGG